MLAFAVVMGDSWDMKCYLNQDCMINEAMMVYLRIGGEKGAFGGQKVYEGGSFRADGRGFLALTSMQ